jgi:sigma-B regulation protein RsbU (phosphoserine phosphatase)
LIKATDRRLYEQELLAARELAVAAEKATQEVLRLEPESSELREQFIAVLGHDFAQPARLHQRRRAHPRPDRPE